MSKQASPPPPGDKPGPGAPPPPPPPPRWRHWLLPVGLLVAFLVWTLLPLHGSGQTSLTYSQFLTDVNAHKVKTVDIPQGTGASSGELTDGTKFTVVLPSPVPASLDSELRSNGVTQSITQQSTGFGTELLGWLITLLPFVVLVWLWMRLSRGASAGMQGVLGVGRSKAKVFDEE